MCSCLIEAYTRFGFEELLKFDDVFVVQQIEDVSFGVCGRPVGFFFERLHRELVACLLIDDQLDDCAGAFPDFSFDFVLVQEADLSRRWFDAVFRDACFFVEGFEEPVSVGVRGVLSVSFG